MNDKVQAYKARLEKQLREVEGTIALKERSRSRLLDKLKDVEASFSKELGRGAVKVSKIAGVEPVKKTKTILKKNSAVEKTAEIPTVEMEFSSPAAVATPEQKTKKERSWLSPF